VGVAASASGSTAHSAVAFQSLFGRGEKRTHARSWPLRSSAVVRQTATTPVAVAVLLLADDAYSRCAATHAACMQSLCSSERLEAKRAHSLRLQ
jgi:hypothetical protein